MTKTKMVFVTWMKLWDAWMHLRAITMPKPQMTEEGAFILPDATIVRAIPMGAGPF